VQQAKNQTLLPAPSLLQQKACHVAPEMAFSMNRNNPAATRRGACLTTARTNVQDESDPVLPAGVTELAIQNQASGANTTPEGQPAPESSERPNLEDPSVARSTAIELVPNESGLRQRRGWAATPTPSRENAERLTLYIAKVVLFKVFDGAASVAQGFVAIRYFKKDSPLFDSHAPFRNFGTNGVRTWLHMGEALAKLLEFGTSDGRKIVGLRRPSPRTAAYLTLNRLFSAAATFGTGMGIAFQFHQRNVAAGIRHGYEFVDAVSTALRLLLTSNVSGCATMAENMKFIVWRMQVSKAVHQVFRVLAGVAPPSATMISHTGNTYAAVVGGLNWTGHLVNVASDRAFRARALAVALDLHLRINQAQSGYVCPTCGEGGCAAGNGLALSIVNTLAFFSLTARIAAHDAKKAWHERFGLPYFSPQLDTAMSEPAGWEIPFALLMDI
jgi:hypothetical protein